MPAKNTKTVRSHKVVAPVKVKKDKAAPKHARSAYTFFLEEVCPHRYSDGAWITHLLITHAWFQTSHSITHSQMYT